MGPCFVWDLQRCCDGFYKASKLEPMLGDHRLYFGLLRKPDEAQVSIRPWCQFSRLHCKVLFKSATVFMSGVLARPRGLSLLRGDLP